MAGSSLILLIDSDAQRLGAMSLLLQRAGYLVITPTDVASVIPLAEEYHPALVLIDEQSLCQHDNLIRDLNLLPALSNTCLGVMAADVSSYAEQADLLITLPYQEDALLAQLSAAFASCKSPDNAFDSSSIVTSLRVALAESHEQLLTVLDSIDADVYVSDLDTYEILFMNEHMRVSFGDDLIGKLCWLKFRKSQSPCLDCTNPQLLDADGQPTGAVTWEGRNALTKRWYINYDRAIKWVDGHYVRLEVSTDITEMNNIREALIKERNRAQRYLDIADVMIIALDAQHTVTLANQMACRILGYQQSEIIGMNWMEHFIPGDIRDSLQSAFDEFVAGEEFQLENNRNAIISRDGTEYIIEWHNTTLRDDNGEITGVLSSGQDVTESVKVEEALRESEDRLAKTLLATRDGMWDWNLVTNSVYFDPRYYEMAGYENDAFPPSLDEFAQRIHPKDVDYVMEEVQKHLDGHTEHFHVEFRFRKADGSYLWVLGRGIIAERAADGTPLRFIGTHTDISLRKSVEETRTQLSTRVRTQAQQMSQILATVPTGVLLINGEGRVLQANPVAEKAMHKLTGAELGGIISYMGDCKLNDLFTSPSSDAGWHEVKSGENIYEVIARPVEIGAEPDHWVLAFTDVTKSREAQAQSQQREQLAAVGQLAAGIAHDFNNILASIVLYAQLIAQSRYLPPDLKERVLIIDRQAQSAAQLVEQMLDFSRRAVLSKRPLDLLPLVKEQVKMLQRSLPEHISIQLDYECETCIVNADPTRMQQMLVNLAVNARDAMPQGGVLRFNLAHLTITPDWSPLLPQMEPGPWVRILVEDTGTGIASDVLPHIFEPFYTTKAPGKGSGLGLAQVHGIVGQHGGRIGVDTIEGGGTAFSIYLPAILQQVPAIEGNDLDQTRGHGETLLVVEDNAILRVALADSLEDLNYTVFVAPNGKAALTVLAEHPEIDLVLSDLVMPVMGGQAMFEALRAQGYTLPVVMLTGHPMEQELEGLREQGLSGWMLKPPDIDDLSRLITQALREARDTE